MKFIFSIACLLCTQAHSLFSQQITVGSIVNGVPTLSMTDAQLTDALSFVLNGATLSNSTI